MFGELSFWQMLMKGGATVIFLMVISVISWWIIIDRLIKFARINTKALTFMERVKRLIEAEDDDAVLTL